MGLCCSVISKEIPVASNEYGHENAILHFDEALDVSYHPEMGKATSVHSREGTKGQNQDSAIIIMGYGGEDGAFCGVFDGHGEWGHTISKLVRNRLPTTLLNQKNNVEWIEASVVNAFKLMDKEIKDKHKDGAFSSGTTAVVVIKQGEDLMIANLGDSRAVLGKVTDDGETSVVQLTTDLKPCVPSEADRIRKHDGRVFALKNEAHIDRVWLPGRDLPGLAMTRAFGDFILKDHGVIAEPDVSHHRLGPDDQFLLLATDGVWDVLKNEEVASIVCKAETEDAAANAVAEAARNTWQKNYPSARIDDITVVCLFLKRKNENVNENLP